MAASASFTPQVRVGFTEGDQWEPVIAAATRLRTKLPAFSAMMTAGTLAQDGGVAIENLASQIPDKDWAALTREFFLS